MQRGLVSECCSGSFANEVRIVDFDRHDTFGIEGQIPRFPVPTSSHEIERPVKPHRKDRQDVGARVGAHGRELVQTALLDSSAREPNGSALHAPYLTPTCRPLVQG